jgi:hypothetical protein
MRHFYDWGGYVIRCACGHMSKGSTEAEARRLHDQHTRGEAEWERRKAGRL